MGADISTYNILTLSMREFYVPATKWLRDVELFETNVRYYNYAFDEDTYENAKGMYIMPYPYKVPIYAEYLKGMISSGRSMGSFGKYDIAKCKESIDRRVMSFITNAVHEDVIQHIDSNYDYGVVCHTISGRHFPFQYSATSGFDFYVGSVSAFIREFQQTRHESKYPLGAAFRAKELDRVLPKVTDKFMMMYSPHYVYEDGDDFFTRGSYGELTEKAFFNIESSKSARDYMATMYGYHAKCIIVT